MPHKYECSRCKREIEEGDVMWEENHTEGFCSLCIDMVVLKNPFTLRKGRKAVMVANVAGSAALVRKMPKSLEEMKKIVEGG